MSAESVDVEKVNILLVDDRWENLVSLKAVLDLPGYNLVKASSGREALKALLHEDFALILLDVQMPILNGFDTAALIKRRERTKSIPIIFITGVSTDEPFIYKGYDSGAVDYICKPFDPDVLRSKVAVFADLFRKTKQIERQAELLRQAEIRRIEADSRHRERHANQKYRELVDGISHGIVWIADPEQKVITFVSPQVERILGYAPRMLLLERDALNGPYFRADFEKMKAAALFAISTGQEVSLEHRVTATNGQAVWFQSSLRIALNDEGRPELRGLSVDITERKESEQALQRSEERFRFLAEVSRVMTESLDADETLNRVSGLAVPKLADHCYFDVRQEDGSLKRTGWAPVAIDQDALNRSELHVAHVGADANDPVHRVIASGEPLIFADSAGEGRSSLVLPLVARGRTLAALTLVYAGSGRRHTQVDLELGLELANRAALALDNAKLYQTAQRAVHLRDEFLSIASHELKTPLTPLKLQLQTLKRFADSGAPASDVLKRLPKSLDTCDRQVTRINKLVDELLDVSRIHSGKFCLELETIDFSEVVREVSQRFLEDLIRADCELKLDLPLSLIGRWDRLRIEQIVTNLISNAIRYAPGAPLHLGLSVEDGKAMLRVKDHGPGIEKHDQDRIFKRFERAAPITTVGGLGLGLYIVSQILAAHGGAITVESEPGSGATFVVSLPIVETSEQAGDAERYAAS